MRVLVAGTDERAIELAGRHLRERGIEVACCHVAGARAFPCLGISGLAPCPLADPVDVVLTVRSHPLPQPARREIGVTCGLRDGVPLVVAGNPALQPFDGHARVSIDGLAGDDLVAACERAAVLTGVP